MKKTIMVAEATALSMGQFIPSRKCLGMWNFAFPLPVGKSFTIVAGEEPVVIGGASRHICGDMYSQNIDVLPGQSVRIRNKGKQTNGLSEIEIYDKL